MSGKRLYWESCWSHKHIRPGEGWINLDLCPQLPGASSTTFAARILMTQVYYRFT